MKDDLGNRMKKYENDKNFKLDVSLPICIRLDGRSFSSFTKQQYFDKPYSPIITRAMRDTCVELMKETHAKIGYTQSDEISLILYNENENGSVLFDGKIQKLTSVLASLAAVTFYRSLEMSNIDTPMFDARVFNLPSKIEAANVIYWRTLDAKRNAISSIARLQYSPKQMFKKSTQELRNMIGEDIINTFPKPFLVGSYFKRKTVQTEMTDDVYFKIPMKNRPLDRTITRTEIIEKDFPETIYERVRFIFDD